MLIRTAQTDAINRMLDLNREAGDDRSWHDPWKVLVYDAFCRDIISPLLKLGDLRKRGITLHLLLDSEREPIPDVPAIYFIQPTRANVKRLGDDCARGLYESYFVNFAPSVARPQLEQLASLALESGTTSQISKVVDQYVNFVSLEEDFFSLQQSQSFLRLNDPAATDTAVESAIEEIVTGLFSAIVTLGTVPVIRYQRGGPAQMVAEMLGRRLHEALRAQPPLFNDAANFLRPVMVVADRSADVGVMLQHAWSYCGLCHDLLAMHLSKVSIVEKTEQGNKPRTYDLQQADAFWVDHMGAAFQTVAADVDKELNEYRAATDEINKGGKREVTDVNETTKALASTIEALPELQEKKRVIDAHMNIATELLGHIKERSLDSFYAVEESLLDGRTLSKEDRATLSQLLESGGTAEDRLRLLLLLLLHPQGASVPSDELQKVEAALGAAGCDLRPLAWLRGVLEMLKMQSSVQQTQRAADGGGGGGVLSKAMKLADHVGVGSNARWVTSALAAGVKQLLPSRRETPLTRAVIALMDNKPGAEDEAYGFIDPKVSAAPDGAAAAARSRSPYGQAVVVVAGPGNYLEYLSLREQLGQQPAAGGGRKVVYGCTEVLTPQQFLGACAQCVAT